MPFGQEAVADLRASAGGGLVDADISDTGLSLKVEVASLEAVAHLLRDHPGFLMSYPADMVAFDSGEGIGLWYRLWSIEHNATVTLHVMLPSDDAVAPSLVHVWPGLNWYERECFDMFGVRFRGHPFDGVPEKMRILLPEDWLGHPFRRDYEPVFAGDPLAGPQETN